MEEKKPYIRPASTFVDMMKTALDGNQKQIEAKVAVILGDLDRIAELCARKGLPSAPVPNTNELFSLKIVNNASDYILDIVQRVDEALLDLGFGLYAHVSIAWSTRIGQWALPVQLHLVWGDRVEGYDSLNPGFERLTRDLVVKHKKVLRGEER